jgi:hypothetical protein
MHMPYTSHEKEVIMQTKRQPTWVSLACAARELDVSGHAVRRMIDRGLLGERRIPGCRPKVSALEVARLAAEHTRPAVTADVNPGSEP